MSAKCWNTLKRVWNICGDWWGLMSGALSIPVYFAAVMLGGSALKAMGVAGIVALLGLVFAMARKIAALTATKLPALVPACGEHATPPTVRRGQNLFDRQTGAIIDTGDLFGFSLTNPGPGIVIKCRAVLTSVE